MDLGPLNVLPFAYEFTILKGTTPPINWSFFGTNDKSSWTLLDSVVYTKENTTDFCPYYTGDKFPFRCGETATKRYYIDNRQFFNYFRMNVYLSRNERQDLVYARHSGFELYGYYSIDFKFEKCTSYCAYFNEISKYFFIPFISMDES